MMGGRRRPGALTRATVAWVTAAWATMRAGEAIVGAGAMRSVRVIGVTWVGVWRGTGGAYREGLTELGQEEQGCPNWKGRQRRRGGTLQAGRALGQRAPSGLRAAPLSAPELGP